jgi:TPR repeat protein
MFTKSFLARLFKPSPRQETMQSRAESGNAEAQFFVGLRYASNKEVADFTRAIEWYLKAAEQNHILAQFNLGVMYSNGQGVLPNERQAEIWFDRAARQQDPGAQHYLGMSRYRASFQGTPQERHESRIEAYKWFALAAASGYQDSDLTRNRVASKMSRQDVTEAALRTDEFLLSARAKARGDNGSVRTS